jgi:hypothetical protein
VMLCIGIGVSILKPRQWKIVLLFRLNIVGDCNLLLVGFRGLCQYYLTDIRVLLSLWFQDDLALYIKFGDSYSVYPALPGGSRC